MGSFITKAIQDFSKTERAQRIKAAIKAYRGYGETPNLERDLETINELLVRHIDPELYSADDIEMAIESHSAKVAKAEATQWWDRELRSLDQVTDLPTPEETEAFFETLDFAMHDQGGASIDRRRA